MSLITITHIISFRELFNKYNTIFVPYGGIFYIHTKQVPTYITTGQNKQRRENYSSLTNQNVEEINITGK